MTLIDEPVFTVGQVVVATSSDNWLLTKGKQYAVVKYEPPFPDDNFTWPAYITVIGDSGKPVTGHTYRFRPLNPDEAIA